MDEKSWTLDVFQWLLEARSDRQLESQITAQEVQNNAWWAVYLFPDNIADNWRFAGDRQQTWWLAWRIAWLPNAVWVPLWFDHQNPFTTPMSAQEAKKAKKAIRKAIKRIKEAADAWKRIVLPTNPDGTSALWNDLAWDPWAQDIINYMNDSLRDIDHNLWKDPEMHDWYDDRKNDMFWWLEILHLLGQHDEVIG